MIPDDLSGLVIDRAQERLAGQRIVCSSPTIGSVFRLEEINPVAVLRVHDEQSGLWIEARGPKIRGVSLVGRDQDSVPFRLFDGIGNRTSERVDTLRPIGCCERLREKA